MNGEKIDICVQAKSKRSARESKPTASNKYAITRRRYSLPSQQKFNYVCTSNYCDGASTLHKLNYYYFTHLNFHAVSLSVCRLSQVSQSESARVPSLLMCSLNLLSTHVNFPRNEPINGNTATHTATRKTYKREGE